MRRGLVLALVAGFAALPSAAIGQALPPRKPTPPAEKPAPAAEKPAAPVEQQTAPLEKSAAAVEKQITAAEKLPRFASLRSDEVNLRVGPGENYPIEWVLKRKDMPVEIIEQFQNWRRVQDWQGDKGWVLDRMLTGKRAVVITGDVRPLRRGPDPASRIVARAEPGVIARFLELQGKWCRIDAGGYRGWVQCSEVWGVFPDEILQ